MASPELTLLASTAASPEPTLAAPEAKLMVSLPELVAVVDVEPTEAEEQEHSLLELEALLAEQLLADPLFKAVPTLSMLVLTCVTLLAASMVEFVFRVAPTLLA